MDKQALKELEEVMKRIGVLQDVSGYKMIELLAVAAEFVMDCDKCPLAYKCKPDREKFMSGDYVYNSCSDVWKAYLNLEIDGKE